MMFVDIFCQISSNMFISELLTKVAKSAKAGALVKIAFHGVGGTFFLSASK